MQKLQCSPQKDKEPHIVCDVILKWELSNVITSDSVLDCGDRRKESILNTKYKGLLRVYERNPTLGCPLG